jgi:predicted transglutaminase-like cysteine proteinase
MPRLRKAHPVIDRVIVIVVLAIAFCCLIMSARADNAPPWFNVGALGMCGRLPAECAPYRKADPWEIELSEENLARLNLINDQVNTEITYQTDDDHFHLPEYWAYPTDGRGDCEDFALEKRRRLVAMGFPRRALLVTIVSLRGDTGNIWHAILIARTDRGDVILDQREEHPTVVSAWLTPDYRYRWVQSQSDPNVYGAWDEDAKPNDTRCYGAGRYDAMRDGANC